MSMKEIKYYKSTKSTDSRSCMYYKIDHNKIYYYHEFKHIWEESAFFIEDFIKAVSNSSFQNPDFVPISEEELFLELL